MVSLDMRDIYLKDIILIGSTAWDEPVFPDLISYIEKGEIRPLLVKTFALDEIAEAQRQFMEKKYFGNFVLIPPIPELECPSRISQTWQASEHASPRQPTICSGRMRTRDAP